MKRFSIAMAAACPFPVNYGSLAAIRELSETLSEMGHDVHVVTYPYGENLSVGTARVHGVAQWRKSSRLQVGPSKDKPLLDLLLLLKLCRVIRKEKMALLDRTSVPAPYLLLRPERESVSHVVARDLISSFHRCRTACASGLAAKIAYARRTWSRLLTQGRGLFVSLTPLPPTIFFKIFENALTNLP